MIPAPHLTPAEIVAKLRAGTPWQGELEAAADLIEALKAPVTANPVGEREALVARLRDAAIPINGSWVPLLKACLTQIEQDGKRLADMTEEATWRAAATEALTTSRDGWKTRADKCEGGRSALVGEALAQSPDTDGATAEQRADAVGAGRAPDWRGDRRAWTVNAEAQRPDMRTALEWIVERDQRERSVCIDHDPAGNTYEVTLVDGPFAAKARAALSSDGTP